MNFENSAFELNKESGSNLKIEIESGFENLVPQDFRQDPIGYFESRGKNIKSGEIERDQTGMVREDPTAVKELPAWTDKKGQDVWIVGKRVNIGKGKVKESGDPFYEYRVMEIVKEAGLPTAIPIAKVEQSGVHLIVMEKVQGFGWHEQTVLQLKENNYSDEDIEVLKQQAEEKMLGARASFEEAGIKRDWKLKDMIFDVDIKNKKVRKVVPVDWERTKIDVDRLQAFKKRNKINK